ncbi:MULTISPECIES: TetR/AcrR family transcriptional regulator C-terminal domain-containing protein [Glycomyces]|uniref:AcrR family transcriptional regulator n=2 Tax=Glycomyces TaxID=58113 RepID=A0A9X3PNE8_9ACTN|nr:TetR/AcrR family transcriptional regulator C-terminal domain-containing protein [Glycomyces lechevalierae]MDA1387139.1 TetR/AcrR family transcriptional regulator C-terminal domain-containing protein [Glycomyces lechevalierae]MDR7336720.1 AcrR family transcriptional regulator [Glycomyces lechevalierae]
MSAATTTAAPRGRMAKRQAILAAAFAEFAARGYAQTGVDEVAAAAGVAKATVYNHFGGKETLLREAITASAEQATAKNLAAVERLVDTGGDLRPTLEDVGLRLIQCYCDDDSWALRRLLYAELAHLPDLLEIVQVQAAERVQRALADRLARLALAGRLGITDPDAAVERLSSLLTGPLEARARWGTRRLPAKEMREVAAAAVDAFLRLYAAGDESGPPQPARSR